MGPGPTGVGDSGRVPPSGARCRGGLDFLWRKSKRKSTRGCGPWTPGVRGGGSSPHTPLLWSVQTGRGVVLPPFTGLRPSQRQAPEGCRPPGRQTSLDGTLRAATINKNVPLWAEPTIEKIALNYENNLGLHFLLFLQSIYRSCLSHPKKSKIVYSLHQMRKSTKSGLNPPQVITPRPPLRPPDPTPDERERGP